MASLPPVTANLKLCLQADAGITVDGSNNVSAWAGQGGTGINATQGTAGSRPAYQANAFNGLPGLYFDGTKTLVTDSFLDSSFNTAYTTFIVTRQVGQTTLQVHSSNQGVALYEANVTGANQLRYNTGNLTGTPQFNINSDQDLMIQTFRYDGTKADLWFNGNKVSTPATGNLGLSGTMTLGQLSSGGFGFVGWMFEKITLNRALNDAEVLQVQNYLGSKWIFCPTINFDGNSICFGTAASDAAHAYAAKTITNLGIGNKCLTSNTGVSGQTIEQMTARIAAAVTPFIRTYSILRISLPFELTNSLAIGGDTGVTGYNAIVADANARRSAGFNKIAVCSCLPRTGGSPPANFETYRQSVRVSLLADFNVATDTPNVWLPSPTTTYADVLLDVGGDPDMGLPGKSTDAAIYSADQIHPINYGHAILSSRFFEPALRLFTQTSPLPGTNIVVTQNQGGTDYLKPKINKVGQPNVTVSAYLQTDWDAGNRGLDYVRDQIITNSSGDWPGVMRLAAGTYAFAFNDNRDFYPAITGVVVS